MLSSNPSAPDINTIIPPPLREELELIVNEKKDRHETVYTLCDPTSNKFVRLDKVSFEILKAWQSGTVEDIVKAVNQRGCVHIISDDVALMIDFVTKNFLCVLSDKDTERFITTVLKTKKTLKKTLTQYLFIKLPLIHPDKFLQQIYPFCRFFFSPIFWGLVGIVTVLSLFLIFRQWHVFIGTIPSFLHIEGILAYSFVIVISKALHELAHALTLIHYKLKVPSMGVAILVFFPLLYTDAGESRRAHKDSQRLFVAAAGILAEIALASFASIAWLVLDDGVWRNAAFVLATTNWVSTVLFNMNPLMRFDGYFILADLCHIENMQSRAFALLRALFCSKFLGLPSHKEQFKPLTQKGLVVYAISCFIYRLIVISSISLIVYHFFFKILGLILFMHQILISVIKPLKMGLIFMYKKKAQIKMTRYMYGLISLLFFILMSVLLPLNNEIVVNAILTSGNSQNIHAPESGFLRLAIDKNTDKVKQGDPIALIQSPEITQDILLNTIKYDELSAKFSVLGFSNEMRQERLVTQSEIVKVKTDIKNAQERAFKLEIKAVMTGRIDFPEVPYKAGQWVAKDDLIATIYSEDSYKVIAYVDELARERLTKGAQAIFYPSTQLSPVKLLVTKVSDYAAQSINDFVFLTKFGGEIAVEDNVKNKPLTTQYRIECAVSKDAIGSAFKDHEVTGNLVIEVQSESILYRLYKKIYGLLVRESVF